MTMAFTNVKYGIYLLLSVLIIKIFCFDEVLLSSSHSTESTNNLELNTAVLSLQVFPEQETLPKPLEITFERLNVSESKYFRTRVNFKKKKVYTCMFCKRLYILENVHAKMPPSHCTIVSHVHDKEKQ